MGEQKAPMNRSLSDLDGDPFQCDLILDVDKGCGDCREADNIPENSASQSYMIPIDPFR
jgi:hypothetical protein